VECGGWGMRGEGKNVGSVGDGGMWVRGKERRGKMWGVCEMNVTWGSNHI
jgi:hypothetical protein